MSQNSVKSGWNADSFGWINSSFENVNKVFKGDSSKSSSRVMKRKKPTKTTYRKKTILLSRENDGVSWNETFCPNNKNELAVHPKKVTEVEEWLKSSFSDVQQSQILLLTGPAGSGKTATIKALSKEIHFEICEWSSSVFESTANTFSADGMRPYIDATNHTFSQSQTSVFRNFLLRANKYSPLFAEHCKRIILVEEFPNVFLRDPSIFHETLRQYYRMAKCPIVFVISESTIGNSLETQLFPKNLQLELRVHQINFNPVAPTMLMKALRRITSSVESCLKSDLEEIVANSTGDVRNAVNTLQFMNMSGNSHTTYAKQKNRKNADVGNCSQLNKRNSSLFLFHALGKILYCKRDLTKQRHHEILPDHLCHLERIPLVENPEEVFSRTSISSEGFSLFLHENYLLFTRDMEAAANSATSFSEADSISVEWSGRDTLNEYSASLAARGLMYNLNLDGTHGRWESLHKPQYYGIMKENRTMSLALKNAFKDSRLSIEELETELVPYLPKLRVPLKNKEQVAVTNKIGRMMVKGFSRGHADSLSSREAIWNEDVDLSDNTLSQPVTLQSIVSESDLIIDPDDEEYEIEDPDS